MKTAALNTTLVDGYVGLLDNLSTSNKLDLISKLTDSVKTDLTNKKSSFKKAFGSGYKITDKRVLETAEEVYKKVINAIGI